MTTKDLQGIAPAAPPTAQKPIFSRRGFLVATAGLGAGFVISGSALLKPTEAWGAELTAITPEQMKTLIVMARDVYPHDRIADKYYAIAVKGYDDAAKKDFVNAGVATLDDLAKARHGVPYANVKWEEDRVAILREIEGSAFFQGVRGGLVVSLYNQEEVWGVFGYEGESASKGGYIERGFADIDWI